jgi:MFS family permease
VSRLYFSHFKTEALASLAAALASVDARRLILANAARMIAYGILGVLFVLYLSEIGFQAFPIGILLTATLIGSALLNLTVVAIAGKFNRRVAYSVAHILMLLAGVVMITQRSFAAFLIASLSGTINFTAPITCGFVALDQSIIPDVTSSQTRNAVYGAYNSVALLARMAGSLISVIPSLLLRSTGLDIVIGYRLMLGLVMLFAFLSFLCVMGLSQDIETRVKAAPLRLERSGSIVRRLSFLFFIDALSTGFVAQSIVILWFNLRFGVGAEVLGPAYSVVRLLQASGYPLAMMIAGRVGLLNTMVFTHLPSQLMLITLPLMPDLPLALGLLFAQQAISNMDIPVRQAYIASVVEQEERTSAASITNLTRNLGQGISPSFSGFALGSLSFGLPFVLSGLIGAIYDIALFFNFRSIEPVREPTDCATYVSTDSP